MTIQGELFGDIGRRKKAKPGRGENAVADCTGMFHGQPVGGEKDAAERMVRSGTLGRHEAHVLAVLRQHPGSTGPELNQWTQYDLTETNRRLTSLLRKHRVYQGERRKGYGSRFRCVTWWPGEGA